MNTGSTGIVSGSSMEPKTHSLDYICRRGSLPLKKRRFTLPDTSFDNSKTDDAKPHASLALLPEHSLSVHTANDEKIAALALVAAASSSFAPLQPPVASVSVPNVGLCETHGALQDESNLKTEDLVAFGDTTQSADTPRRAHRPPLASPLPGGCHGRTARNNSYCRRQPCYNGSQYCKLHYQHYVVAGNRSPVNDDEASLTCQPVQKTPVAVKTAGSAAHQDKRYTGGHDEERCSATTTRGRACAFIAVSGTKYCYLHADYDTNPPPRRHVAVARAKTTRESPFRLGKDSLTTLESVPSIASDFSAAEVSIASPPSVASEASSRMPSPFNPGAQARAASGKAGRALKSGRTIKPSRRTASKLAEMHAESPFPLLSMISTDQWYNKTVKIATGPLIDRVGKVEKWGNGWVSVNVPRIGSHNRRSFELYLMDEDEDTKESPAIEAAGEQLQNNASLLRCVSREAVSPSPSSLHESSSVSKPVNMTEADSSVTKGKSRVRSAPAVVPETPKPQYAHVSVQDTPAMPKRTVVGQEGHLVPKVTPSTPKKAKSIDDMPLVKSLLLAEEGRSKLDLLFGTAALERGRRTIHKPTRYEDKALLAKKRGRKVSLEPECETPGKRKRPSP